MPKRGSGKRIQAATGRAGARGKGAQQLPPDMEDEIDLFHKSKDKLAFRSDESDADMDEELDEEAVLDIEAAGSDDDDEVDGDLDSEDEIEAALARGGHDAELAKQAKALRQRLRVQQGEDSDDAAEEDQDADDQLWGKKRRMYYGADEEGATDEDEQYPQEAEEAEAMRLKQEAAAQLAEEDYALLSSEEESGDEGTMGAAACQAASGAAVERIDRDGADVTAQREAVLRAAPELEALARELSECMQELRGKVGPLLQEVQSGGLVTQQGVSYLEAKHLLLLQYCMHIVFYLLLKAEGRSVQDHPVIAKLVQIRSYLDKIRPIDKRLAYQIDRLLLAARSVHDHTAPQPDTPARNDDPMAFAPNPDALLPADGAAPQPGDARAVSAGAEGDTAGVYRPPRLNPTAMEDDPDRPASAKQARRAARLRHKAMRSEMVRELMAEVEEAPEELGARGVGALSSGAAVRELQQRNKITEVEEELMTRIVLSKEERARLKALRHERKAAASGALLDGFDELADLVEVGQAELDRAMQRPGRGVALGNLSQTYGVDLSGLAKQNVRGGDDDLPARPSLAARRAKTDVLRVRQAAATAGSDDEVPTLVGKRSRGDEDEFYQASVAAATAKKAARRESFKRADLAPPLADPTTPGARKIDRTIEKNRGLTPHRRRDLKNPRKKNRVKFAKAEVRRKGQVQGVREAPGAGYGGEATGINARVSKSVRF